MRNLQFKKELKLNLAWYWLTILLGVSVVFLVDSLLFVQFSGNSSLNEKHFLGLLGNNISAILTSLILIGVYCAYAIKNKLLLPMWFVAVGAFSNLLGRFYLGGVTDYINLSMIPTFNTADILIILGLLLTVSFKIKKA